MTEFLVPQALAPFTVPLDDLVSAARARGWSAIVVINEGRVIRVRRAEPGDEGAVPVSKN